MLLNDNPDRSIETRLSGGVLDWEDVHVGLLVDNCLTSALRAVLRAQDGLAQTKTYNKGICLTLWAKPSIMPVASEVVMMTAHQVGFTAPERQHHEACMPEVVWRYVGKRKRDKVLEPTPRPNPSISNMRTASCT